ncbi:MAG TPA: hypothetical protein VLI54_00090 [Bacillota bacterium]|nr:hypothetical protein [Bacillota bacterium]
MPLRVEYLFEPSSPLEIIVPPGFASDLPDYSLGKNERIVAHCLPTDDGVDIYRLDAAAIVVDTDRHRVPTRLLDDAHRVAQIALYGECELSLTNGGGYLYSVRLSHIL